MSNLIEIKKTIAKLKTTCFAIGRDCESCRNYCEYLDHWDDECMSLELCNDINAVFDYCDEAKVTEDDVNNEIYRKYSINNVGDIKVAKMGNRFITAFTHGIYHQYATAQIIDAYGNLITYFDVDPSLVKRDTLFDDIWDHVIKNKLDVERG